MARNRRPATPGAETRAIAELGEVLVNQAGDIAGDWPGAINGESGRIWTAYEIRVATLRRHQRIDDCAGTGFGSELHHG